MKPAGRCGRCLAYAMPSMHQASLSSHFPDRRWQSILSTGVKTLQQQFISPGKLEHANRTIFRSTLTSGLLSRETLVSKRVGYSRKQADKAFSLIDGVHDAQRAVSRNLTMLGSCFPIETTGSVRQRKPFEPSVGKAPTILALVLWLPTPATVYWAAPHLFKSSG